ncbi:T9SS C-terminal target domain-containing protein [Chryseobacterium indologenes]|uniref:T9SS type A sorting domain-containing protein n=1 Tax=Chryseobacterium indologenes TaxID=253 RepID=UPI000F5134C1|nr:T9SS type A sorting domain-containing protein [Chryseobacterium indologenes]AYZ37445.1 T9SS C-terminal target domain-containing protein [Chryseobacterium indologenes]MBF6646316.1 T9SS type A sorting domain-containing protein [Chryseobacterium indologenes]MBU3049963.1 T9SS type A sorting domain-containing protein [Chryseobacterium indologenes]MEB4761739.1 T9SS type A sorting domain-containing protein [Chryseobacterium indologenes]QQQ70011.1 T9SS type A sorting domain-containing protein [Chry
MKFNLLLKERISLQTAFVALLLFSSQTLVSAQNRIYAHAQSSGVFGVACLGCRVDNPENAVGDNEDNYSTMVLGTALLGGIQQTLVFPDLRSDTRLVVGIGTDNIPLSVQLLSGVSLETMNGGSSNNDRRTVDVSLLKLGATPNRGTIEFKPSKPYDGIRIGLSGGVLSLGGGFRIYYAYQDPLNSLMAHSQNGQITLDGNIAVDGAEVSLVNTSGKEVYRSTLRSKTFDSRQSEGIYIMTLKTKEGKMYSRKIMIK